MRKQLFSVMLFLSDMGGMALCPVPGMAATEQSQTILVKGQVVDQEGQPLIGATLKVK